MKKKLTINDIAKLAGVGKSTVSRYFNDGYVKEETREKIKKVIAAHDYQPNQFAASLKARESKLIGVIAPCLDSTISSRMLMEIDESLIESGYRSIVVNTNHLISREIEAITRLWQMKVDGIILLATKVTEEHRELVRRIGLPVVFLGQEVTDFISIRNDDFNAGFDAGQLIGKSAPHQVLIVGVSEEDEAIGKIRQNGIIAGLKDQGVTNVKVVESDFSFETTRKLVGRELDESPYDAIICATDKMAMAAFQEIKTRKLHIPNDVELVGFGGYEIAGLLNPKITSFRFESETAGKQAVATIIEMIKGNPVNPSQLIGYVCITGESVKN